MACWTVCVFIKSKCVGFRVFFFSVVALFFRVIMLAINCTGSYNRRNDVQNQTHKIKKYIAFTLNENAKKWQHTENTRKKRKKEASWIKKEQRRRRRRRTPKLSKATHRIGRIKSKWVARNETKSTHYYHIIHAVWRILGEERKLKIINFVVIVLW